MALCRSLFCHFGRSHVQHMVEVKVINGSIRNSLTVTNKKSLLSSNAIRTMRIRNDASRPIKTKGVAPENIGLTFEGMRTEPLSLSMLWKPLVFTTSFSAGTLLVCTIWQYESVMKKAGARLKEAYQWHWSGSPWRTKKKHFEWREEMNKAWNNLKESQKLYIAICLTNILVHLAWKVPKFETTMIRYFSSNPRSNAICWPLLFATFSHYSTVHIAMNMYALYSFSGLGVHSLGKEQFLGLYLVGGVVSSFTSLFFRVLRKKPNLSLGASGAILTVIGYISAKYPNLELSIIGLPMCTFTATTAIKTLILFDLAGLTLGWKLLDHAAHLGGVFFGIFWYYWGNPNIWQKREPFLHWWHEFRNSMR